MKNEQHVRRLVFTQMLKLLGLKSQSGLFQMWFKKKKIILKNISVCHLTRLLGLRLHVGQVDVFM